MRALACPASLKGVLSAGAAAGALATGLRAGGADAVELPLADGGEGTAATLLATLGGEWREATVHDAYGRPRVAPWLLLPDGTAVADAARGVNRDVIVLCHGGPISEPDDAAYVLQRTKNVHGFYGASSMERLPVETAIEQHIRKFKSVRFR